MPAVAEPDTGGRRNEILRLLQESDTARGVAGLADELRVHPNTVRFHLNALVRTGDVEQVSGGTAGPGRPPVLFRAVRRMDPAGPTNYRLLADIMTSHFETNTDDPRAAAAELGRRWGPSLVRRRPQGEPSRQETLAELTDVLADVGFRPDPPVGRSRPRITLRHCPFYELVTRYGETICGLHLGLMQGVLAAIRGPVSVAGLDPLVEPDLCVAHLSTTPGWRRE